MTRPPTIRIEAATRGQRNEMIARVSEALQSVGASVLDSRFFSNVALFIEAEVPAARLPAVIDALAETQLQLDSRSVGAIRTLPRSAQMADLCLIHLSVTFIHNDPDLRITVPAIPG